jgi:hypothetical protein
VKPFNVVGSESLQLTSLRKELSRRAQEMKQFDLSDTIVLKEVAVKSKGYSGFDDNLQTFGYPEQQFIITPQDDKEYTNLGHYLLTNVSGAVPDQSGETNGIFFQAQGKSIRPRFVVDRRADVFNRLDYFTLNMKDIEKVVVRHLIGAPERENDAYRTPEGVQYRANSIRDVYIIHLSLKPTAFARSEPSLINTRVNGYYQSRVFYEPRYLRASTKQDLRTTIYWQPNVTTNANGEAIISYYNADPKTKVRVMVQGINDKGAPVAGSLFYEVK